MQKNREGEVKICKVALYCRFATEAQIIQPDSKKTKVNGKKKAPCDR